MLREGLCAAGCGAKVEIRTNPRINCPDCRLLRKRESARKAMERQRRKRGIARVLGTKVRCERCQSPVVLNRCRQARWCRQCASDVALERARARSAQLASTPEGREAARSYDRRRASSDPAFKLSRNMRSLIARRLERGKEGRRWQSLVGYTIADLMRHLERQFLPGMSWDNRGDWHIDHIRPLSGFEFSTPDCPQFREAWALSNLRPLWAKDNLTKNARRLHLL